MSLRTISFRFVTLSLFLTVSTLAWAQELPTSQDYMQSAQLALQDNDINRAIQDYYLAIKLDPRNWQAYQNLGGCYIQLRKMDYAKAAYIRSLAINPNNPELIRFMGQVWKANPSPTPTLGYLVPIFNSPTPTPTFYGIMPSTPPNVPNAIPTFTFTPTPTPGPVQVIVPFIEVPTPITPKNGPARAPVPFKGFKPYVYQELARYNLPDVNTFTWDIGGAAWFGGAKNFNDYFGSDNLNPAATASTAGEIDLGGDFALVNEFQLGIHAEGMKLPVAPSQLSPSGSLVEWDSNCLGGALAAKYLIAFDKAMSLVLHVEGGYYSLISSDIKCDNGSLGTVNLSGTAIGGLAAVELELFQVEDKSIALDFGFGYRTLTFNTLTGSGSINGTPFTGKNLDGTPAYIDFSGPRISASLRFIH